MLVISSCFLGRRRRHSRNKYPNMAPLEYLMERNAEILLARSAAPDFISGDATILVFGRLGPDHHSVRRRRLLQHKRQSVLHRREKDRQMFLVLVGPPTNVNAVSLVRLQLVQ